MPEARAPVGGGPKKLMSGRSFFRADLPVDDRTVLPARRIFRLLGRPMNYMLFSWAEPGRGSRYPRDPGFMNPTGAPEPRGDLCRIVRGIFCLAGGCARAHPQL